MIRQKLSLLCSLLLIVVFQPGALVIASETDDKDDEVGAWPLFEPCRPSDQGAGGTAPSLDRLKQMQPPERIAAIDRLVRLCDLDQIDLLLVSLGDEAPDVRVAAIRALGQLRYPQGSDARLTQMVEQLIPLTADPDWRVRFALTRTLASFQLYPASNAVLNLIANPGVRPVVDAGDMRARCAAILMVNQLRDVRFSRKAISFLASFVDHENPLLRTIAARTVLELKQTRNGYHELVAIARKPGIPQQRILAIEWLRQWRMAQARPIFEEIATTEANPQVRAAAVRALGELKD